MREEMSEARPAKYSWVARMQMYCVCTVPCCTYVHTSKKLESVESRLVINLDFPPIFLCQRENRQICAACTYTTANIVFAPYYVQ